VLLHDCVRTVGRTVRGDDDLEALEWVVELEKILEAAADHVLLVVGGDDERDGRRHVLLSHRPGPHACENTHRSGVAGMRPGQRAE